MRINITAGECLNNILKSIYEEQFFIPFNEAMNVGFYSGVLFSDEFMIERAKVHNVTVSSYQEKLKEFINFLNQINKYNEVILWFGDDEFCKENIKIVLKTLDLFGYKDKIILNIVNENNGEIIKKLLIR